jgi:DMSO/TMAO reductase YedYZ molybdopterin-dependent catalytic subunit
MHIKQPMFSRRALIASGVAGAAALPALAERFADLALPGGPSQRPLSPIFPQKGEMIVQRVHPPLLETPFEIFDKGVITPNDRFFVRWSGGVMPTSIEAAAHRLKLHGAVKRPASLTLDEVARAGETVEVTAINQCAGNGRGLQEPRVTGAQWAHGAMGNARWRGVRLRDVLDHPGIGGNAKRVRFAGLDTPMTDGAPQFTKSLPIDVARRDDVIVAWGMNGEMLPLLNGYPLRLVVPGWFATYWVKMLSDIEVLDSDQDDSYFMAKTYRMPTVPVKPGDKDFPTVPITTMPPRSWITSHAQGARVERGRGIELRGIAMGGDVGVARVDVIVGDRTLAAKLGPDEGALGFRRWTATLPPFSRELVVGTRCTNANGMTQPEVQAWNPSGYARNVIERITLVPA